MNLVKFTVLKLNHLKTLELGYYGYICLSIYWSLYIIIMKRY